MKRDFDDILLGSIELFCLAAEFNSFSAASVAAGVTPAAVSRSVSRLEQRLKTQLFTRNTRKIILTSAGRLYYERCHHALAIMRDANTVTANDRNSFSGSIYLSLPTTYAHFRVLPLLKIYREKNPDVDIHLHISNSNINFFEENFDLAIRVRENKDSNLVARRIEDAELVVVASPDYLSHHGEPKNLIELMEHQCIQFELPSNGKSVPWLFTHQGTKTELVTRGNLYCAKEVLGGVALAKAGAGLYQIYRFVVEKDLRNGSLVEILKNHGGCSRPFSILYPYSKFLPLKTRAFMDFLVDAIRENISYSDSLSKANQILALHEQP